MMHFHRVGPQQAGIPAEHPFLIRVAGQSGSGKSSQLSAALNQVLKNLSFIKISVGAFASFHPFYDKWQKTEPDKMREKTNGFALRSLVLFYKYCLLHKVNVLLDMTLLEPEVDLYLMTLAKSMGYRIQTHVLCVPKKVSDHFIRCRQKATGRCVWSSSSLYFFKALAPSLAGLLHSKTLGFGDRLILWSHSFGHPIKITHFSNVSAMKVLMRYRSKTNRRIYSPRKILKQKIYWMNLLTEDIKNA